MHAFIITFGSRGDVQPYVALGKGLMAAGHQVTLCTSQQFQPFIEEHGLAYGYMTGELLELIDTDAGRAALEDTNGLFGTAKTMLKLVKQTKPLNRQMMIDSWESIGASPPDCILYNIKALAAVHIADKFDIPAILALPFPQVVPTSDFPTVGMPDLNWRAYNKFSFKFVDLGMRTYAKMVNEFRQEQLGLEQVPKQADVLHRGDGTPIPVLHGYSQHVIPHPADWPEQAHITGYWFLEAEESWTPPTELEAFLAAGEPPVYIGFGSMAGRDPQRLTQIIVEGLQQAGVRGIIATGWGGLEVSELPETILKIENAPHDWLFPRVAAVVHHGGAGTTAAGLRAGKPTLVCAFFGDQPFWGKRVEALGVGPAYFPQKKLTAGRLAQALQQMTQDEQMLAAAAALGEKIRAEDGVGTAVGLIERFVGIVETQPA